MAEQLKVPDPVTKEQQFLAAILYELQEINKELKARPIKRKRRR